MKRGTQYAILAGIVLLIIIFTAIPSTMKTTTQTPEIESKSEQDLSPYTKAYFAGGCFWCMEAAFQDLEGVKEAISGYMGGVEENPTYEQVVSGNTGHHEAVVVYYDPSIISYRELLDIFWRQIDPTDTGGQFADRGSQYQTAIFYATEEEKQIAEESKKNLEDSKKFEEPIVTKVLKITPFYPAEEYHQDYYIKRTLRYKAYEQGSGRASYKKNVWDV